MDTDPNPQAPRSLVLIGFMGSGKTTIGRKLQDQLGYPLVDTDQLIEEREGKTIRDIFADQGEPAFRDMETGLLEELGANSVDRRIVSTGGGIIGRERNRTLLRDLGFVVWLKVCPTEIRKRTARNKGRPLLQTEEPDDTIARLMAEREPLYRQTAHLELETTGLDLEEVCAGILDCASYHFTRTP